MGRSDAIKRESLWTQILPHAEKLLQLVRDSARQPDMVALEIIELFHLTLPAHRTRHGVCLF